MCFDVVCFYSKDPQGSGVDIVEESDYTGIISFPDFKIPSNPRYLKIFINKVFFKKTHLELLVVRQITSQMKQPTVKEMRICKIF